MRQETTTRRDESPVEATVSGAVLGPTQATRLPLQRRGASGFTLAELLVTAGVLVLLVFFASQLLKSAGTITTIAHKRMDIDSQSRQLLDRMAIDFAQMVKRSDVDYYLKSSWFASSSPTPAAGCATACSNVYSTGVRTLLQSGNDTIAFYSTVPGYYPSTGLQSPVSLVAYRVNSIAASSSYNKLERLGKGLLWNGSTPTSGTPPPVVFMPVPLASPIAIAELPFPTPNPMPPPAWALVASSITPWSDSEVIGPQVFRFEYYYLLKGQTNSTTGTTYNPVFTDTPWDTRICACPSPAPTPSPTPGGATPTPTPLPTATPPVVCCHTAPEGMQDVAAVVVVIAVIDPKSKALLDTVDPTGAKLARLNGSDGNSQGPVLIDWGSTSCAGCPSQTQWQTTPGLLAAQWRAALDANTVGLPPPAISGIRVYERYLYLSPPTLLTP